MQGISMEKRMPSVQDRIVDTGISGSSKFATATRKQIHLGPVGVNVVWWLTRPDLRVGRVLFA
jgi:hypothetical protein